MKTVGIMQPYLFPYIGYYQLIGAVDVFVVYDDVTYIKGGWINRNQILGGSPGSKQMFTLPLSGASSNLRIGDIEVDARQLPLFHKKFTKTLQQIYRKAPHLEAVTDLSDRCFGFEDLRLGHFLNNSLRVVCDYLGLAPEWVPGSAVFNNQHLHAQERVLDICRQLGGTRYLNAIGGQELYDKPSFAAQGMELQFIRPAASPYSQLAEPFVPYLSILDVMMFNSPAAIRPMLDNYTLV